MTTINELNKILSEADCLVDEAKLNEALDKMAAQISADLADKLPLVLCVMNGGLVPTAALIERLDFPLELDYIHATRYGMETEGASLNWLSYPQTSLKDRHILVIDDIFDQGHTLEAIVNWLETQTASSVYTATVINKLHDRKTNMVPDYVGTDVVDRFLFGYGMDYKGFFRNLKGIYAIKGS
ncbi:hypoxanthine-guanine phosphoribosyltransferase [Marinomonas sp. M1K-6]|uniref:Hypoxanthine-guanine phosphoribosyltransferase n=1 Tax=Marinomonas profundi TaxID=2726122 RepID=A0A847QVA9_9GAMM|nr:hypoxanthine-guanine phosphoribosyltransferase [Marinomonas profundi]NLQ16778.1 hypoxanthine-guanine phosphoribosyltransferase [Marinomonas profundi]UDV02512.1 hypoxanthine-guanine phosphoribosyltransferase [Marinomonas profundi]